MKAVVVHAPGEIRWEEVTNPDLPPGWARVEVRAVGVCSSDVPRALDGTAYHYPIVLGHEMAGVVAEVGGAGHSDLLGQRVAVAPLIPCGRCEWCARGRYSLCDDYDYLGSRRNGGCAEFVAAPPQNLVRLPDEVSFEAGALLEPASVVLHGMRGTLQAGDDVAVVGVGSLGLLAIQLARILGVQRVFALDVSGDRLAIAASLGAAPIAANSADGGVDTVLRITQGRGADVVVETCGVPSAQAQCLALARKGGRVVFMGLPHDEVTIAPGLFRRLVREELELHGSWNSYSAPYPGVEWHACVAYMASGQLRTEPVISHRIPLQQAHAAYRLMREGAGPVGKVVLLNVPARQP